MLGSCVKARLKASKAFLHSFHSFLTTLFFFFFFFFLLFFLSAYAVFMAFGYPD